jgi:hypothetical protein
MEKSARRQIKLPKFDPKLDVDEFNQLTDILFELMKESGSRCARILGISRSTWRKWTTNPPRQWWWNVVLRTVIKHYITALHARRGLTGKHRRTVMDMLAKIPHSDEFMEELAAMAYDLEGATRFLRDTLAGKGMFWDELRKPANSGGYTQQTLRKAARMIGVVKRSEGFGDEKRSYWRLPNEDDD